jgi:hypothetical protein
MLMARERWKLMTKDLDSYQKKVASSVSEFSHLTPPYCGFMQSEQKTTFRASTIVKLCDDHFQVKSFQQLLETLNVK